MNQDLTNELAEARAQLEAAKTRIERVEAELAKESKPWEPWKPEIGQTYWWIDDRGVAYVEAWDNHRSDKTRRDFNNCFTTAKAAERHALRLRSMRPTCPVPKVGDRYWVVITDENGQYVEEWVWIAGDSDVLSYKQGTAFAAKEAAEAWIAEFGEAWTTLEDEA